MNKILEREGYLFITSGCEHGPTIMIRKGDWNKEEYKKLREWSWCDNEFSDEYGMDELGYKDAYEKDLTWAEEIAPDLKAGKKYRIIIEELPLPDDTRKETYKTIHGNTVVKGNKGEVIDGGDTAQQQCCGNPNSPSSTTDIEDIAKIEIKWFSNVAVQRLLESLKMEKDQFSTLTRDGMHRGIGYNIAVEKFNKTIEDKMEELK